MATSLRRRFGFRSVHEIESTFAFTLIEILVAVTIIAAISVILLSVVNQTGAIWRWTSSRTEQFRESRDAFESMAMRISQATLNTYWDYNSTTMPTAYERRSELRFISGPASQYLGNGISGTRVTHCIFFHAPFGSIDTTQGANSGISGLDYLLNVWGYYVEFNDDTSIRPAFLSTATKPWPPKYRFRLMEFRQSSEQMATYRYTSGLNPKDVTKAAAIGYQGADWYKPAANQAVAPCRVLAQNIIALIITPRLSKQDEQNLPAALQSSNPDFSPLAPSYCYDSSLASNPGQPLPSPFTNPKSQLPPVLQITLVAIDEASADRLNLTAASSNVFGLSAKFSTTANYSSDLLRNPGAGSGASLENTLVALKVNYRIFTTSVAIRSAKWSRNQ
jgi:uncharacterized protein (TIGR02599 family)